MVAVFIFKNKKRLVIKNIGNSEYKVIYLLFI